MPKHAVTKSYSETPDAVWSAVGLAVRGTPASIDEEDEAARQLKAKHGVGVWSWGEALEITVTGGEGGGSNVAIQSKSRMPLTLFDWGKNKRNVRAIEESLDAALTPKGDS